MWVIHIWLNQHNFDINLQWLKEHVKSVLIDLYMQVWREGLENSTKYMYYKEIKEV